MPLEISCPSFRCPKTSVHLCAGYRRKCDRYYCQVHTEGNLCERCEGDKREDMSTTYKQMMKDISRKALSAGMSGGAGVLFVISLLLLAAAVVLGFKQRSNQGLLPLFVITLCGGALGFILALVLHQKNARDYMRSESLSLDQEYPGFYDFYQKWQKIIDDISSR